MRDRFLAAWRTAVQAAFALTLAWLAGNGIHVNDSITGWAEALAFALGAGVWAWLTHWVQTLPSDAWWAKAARAIVGILLLGATSAPAYRTPAR